MVGPLRPDPGSEVGAMTGNAALRRKRAAMLLEVVVSVGLLTFGLAVVGVQVRAGLDAARTTDRATRAMLLTDTVLAELDGGFITWTKMSEEAKGDFGVTYPGYTWRLQFDKADVEGLYMVTVQIGYNEGQVQQQIDDPALEISFDDDGRMIERTAYRLYAAPADVNMERDYGLSSQDIQEILAASTAGTQGGSGSGGGGSGAGSAGGGQGGGSSGDVSVLADLADQAGIDLSNLDFLFDPNGFDPRMLANLPDEDFQKISALLDLLANGGSGLKDLKKLQNQLGDVNLNDLAGRASQRGGPSAGGQGSSSRGGQGGSSGSGTGGSSGPSRGGR